VPMNPIIRSKTRYFRHAYRRTRNNKIHVTAMMLQEFSNLKIFQDLKLKFKCI
jgi:hypothetical protein